MPVNDAEWVARSACRSAGPDEVDWWWPLSPEDPVADKAKAVCWTCAVRADCLAYAREMRIDQGIWGGLDEYERRRRMQFMPRPAGEAPVRPRPRDPRKPKPRRAPEPVALTSAQLAARERATKAKLRAAREHLRALGWPRERITAALAEMDGGCS
jgi:WhiB family redox-sensing transcriptional regulator